MTGSNPEKTNFSECILLMLGLAEYGGWRE